MPYEKKGLRDSRSSNDITQCEYATSEAPPYRRYTEGSNFRARTQFEADVLTNSSSDLLEQRELYPEIQRSLSDDFQDSLYFSNPPQRTMSLSGGTHSLPAFLSGNTGNHSALLQQIQANQRAVENDYSDQPPAGVGPPMLPRTLSHGTRTHGAHSHRHRHLRRHASGHRSESASRHRSNREEGAHPAFRSGFTTTERHFVPLRDVDLDTPPPRPPLSRFHFEHAGPGRALRISSSLPSSLTFNAGDSILVPMAHNAAPSRHNRHERRGRYHRRVPDTMGHTAPRSQRGYSLTPPPVCRANKPRYDGNNRLIQTVSSPNVVTHCVGSTHSPCRIETRPTPRIEQPTSKNTSTKNNKADLALLQPTHVVISQQPRRKSSKKDKQKKHEEDDEITRQKKGLVVSLNNNVAKCPHSVVTVQSKDGTTTMSSISSKLSDDCILKKEECTPMVHATDESEGDGLLDDSDSVHNGSAKPGDHNYPCPRCGKCTCERCQELPGPAAAAARRMAAHCYMCNHRCLCTVDSCVETATCLCCVRGLFYHCSNYEDDDICADKPCSCHSDKCCLRWTVMGALSACMPCLWCYPLARGCVKLCRGCSGSMKPGCKCKEVYR